MEGWIDMGQPTKVGWPIADALPTKWSHVNHGSGVDQGKSASYRPTFLPLSHAANLTEEKRVDFLHHYTEWPKIERPLPNYQKYNIKSY